MSKLIVLMLALLVSGHKISKSYHVDTRAQFIQQGDHTTWYVGRVHGEGPSFEFMLHQALMMAHITRAPDTIDVVTEDGRWVHTVRGFHEPMRDFIARARR